MTTITNNYVHRVEIINGKKILEEQKIEYETPFEKNIRGITNGQKYSISIQKKPKKQKRVTFRVWNPVYRNHRIERRLTPYFPTTTTNSLKIKKSNKCKDTKKRKKN